ncbi:type III polyketide synthase [Reyranella sp. CPCC 100927]|uniref:type III polyketide synthase n=1 Tax=Reyranella sp. CPCC 100927 TaxID=2599616 RepID=UPI0011B670AB|nr:3-oxoacyl-[acyl-carrier-protein] synthase III C-terminal domain-containing protein [Reyranella sp. CPCC 100927]TWT02577.1 type III polyketide synthase [Reyranella sp. CPCC 100927]
MTAIARLLSLATAAPAHAVPQRDLMQAAGRYFGANGVDVDRLLPAFLHAGIDNRHLCEPLDWYQRPIGWKTRNDAFLRHAPALLADAARRAVADAGLSFGDIDQIVTVCSTGVATPSLDALLMERLPFRETVGRLPIFGLGCAGGVTGLGAAARLARAEPGTNVLFLVVELCTLTFRSGDRRKANIIATALFGDGAAAAVVRAQTIANDNPAILHAGERRWPGTLDVMGWDVAEDGLTVLFSRDIPALVRDKVRPAACDYLARHGLGLADIDGFIAHPGGAKVIDALEEVFGLQTGGMVDARAVLRDYGNMSAATVMFVLDRMLRRGLRGRNLMSALGPGFTGSFLTLEAA